MIGVVTCFVVNRLCVFLARETPIALPFITDCLVYLKSTRYCFGVRVSGRCDAVLCIVLRRERKPFDNCLFITLNASSSTIDDNKH